MTLITLPRHCSEAEAAAALGVSIDTLQRVRRAGKIRFRRLGTGRGRIRYTEADLLDYLERCKESTCQTVPCDMANTGLASDPTARSGAEHGTTPESVKHAAHRLAQTTLRKPTADSLRGSWKTARPATSDPQTFQSNP